MPGNGGGARISASPAARAAKPPPAHYLHELPAQDEERLASLFQRLDLDGNGRVDVHDLSQALREVGVHTQYAQVFIKRFFTTYDVEVAKPWTLATRELLWHLHLIFPAAVGAFCTWPSRGWSLASTPLSSAWSFFA